MLSYLYSTIYDFFSLQNIHCKRVTGKYVFLKELVALRDIEREKPGHGTGLFLTLFLLYLSGGNSCARGKYMKIMEMLEFGA
jgi:hypothetical protein